MRFEILGNSRKAKINFLSIFNRSMAIHFYFSYVGNKRKEINEILPYIYLDDIKTIVEPFCGSCAFSFFLSKNDNLAFHINDLDANLINFFNKIVENKELEIYNTVLQSDPF